MSAPSTSGLPVNYCFELATLNKVTLLLLRFEKIYIHLQIIEYKSLQPTILPTQPERTANCNTISLVMPKLNLKIKLNKNVTKTDISLDITIA